MPCSITQCKTQCFFRLVCSIKHADIIASEQSRSEADTRERRIVCQIELNSKPSNLMLQTKNLVALVVGKNID